LVRYLPMKNALMMQSQPLIFFLLLSTFGSTVRAQNTNGGGAAEQEIARAATLQQRGGTASPFRPVSASLSAPVLSLPEIGFTGQAHHLSVLLCWSAKASSGKQPFAVERSEDGVSWQQIGTVKQPGSSGSFSYWDTSVWPGQAYQYRLSQPAMDGAVARSKVLNVEVDSCMDEALLALLLIGLVSWFTRVAKKLL
jgi:hypothetical protein